jgi:hypothetical protein
MRNLPLGFTASLIVLNVGLLGIIGTGAVIWVVNGRADYAHHEVRATVEWNLREYEEWQRVPGREEIRESDPAIYQALLDDFLLRHDVFAAYQEWWIETQTTLPQRTVAEHLTADPRLAAELQNPRYLNAYLNHRLPHHLPFHLPGVREDAYHAPT